MLINNARSVQAEHTSNALIHDPLQELKSRGVTILRSADFSAEDKLNLDVKAFARYWNDLEPDNFMCDRGRYRKRRFGRYRYERNTASLSLIAGDQALYQSEDIDQLNVGYRRKFAPVCNAFATDEFFASIVNRCLKIFFVLKPSLESLTISAHLVRITCGSDSAGLPTPEGIHRDGYCFVSQHLINRQNIYGGVSCIYNSKNEPILHSELTDPLDSILLDDNVVKHDVSPVISSDQANEGHRDMLIIGYKFASPLNS